MGVPEGEEREQGIENLFEKIMMENFPNLVKETDVLVQEAQRVTNKMGAKKPIPRHLIIKMPKTKDKENLKNSPRKVHPSPTFPVSFFLTQEIKCRLAGNFHVYLFRLPPA